MALIKNITSQTLFFSLLDLQTLEFSPDVLLFMNKIKENEV